MFIVPRAAGSLICKYKEFGENTTCCSRLNVGPQTYLRGTSHRMEVRRRMPAYLWACVLFRYVLWNLNTFCERRTVSKVRDVTDSDSEERAVGGGGVDYFLCGTLRTVCFQNTSTSTVHVCLFALSNMSWVGWLLSSVWTCLFTSGVSVLNSLWTHCFSTACLNLTQSISASPDTIFSGSFQIPLINAIPVPRPLFVLCLTNDEQ